MKKILSFVLACAIVAGISTQQPADAAARNEDGQLTAVKTTINLNKHESKRASRLSKATGLSRDKIATLMDKGYTEEDIKTVYTASTFTDDKLNKVFDKYDEVEKKQEKLLEAYKIDPADFQKKQEKLFRQMENGENHLRDRVKWKKAPFDGQ